MAKRKTDKSKEKRIYCGPKIESDLRPYTIFIGDPPLNVQEHIDKCPQIKKLMVPIEKLSKTKERIKEKGTKEHDFYEEVKKYIGGE